MANFVTPIGREHSDWKTNPYPVTLITGFTPNTEDNNFFYPITPEGTWSRSRQQWRTAFYELCINKAREAFGVDNWREMPEIRHNDRAIVTKEIELAAPLSIAVENNPLRPWEVTYCILTPQSPGVKLNANPGLGDDPIYINVYKFYHVAGYELIGDRIRFTLVEDLWAEYISQADITRKRVIRANFDPALNTGHALVVLPDFMPMRSGRIVTFTGYENIQYSLTDIVIVCSIKFTAYKSISENLSRQYLFVYSPWDSGATKEPALSLAFNEIQNIYQTEEGGDAEVFHIYLLPKYWIPEQFPLQYGFKTITDEGREKDLFLGIINPSVMEQAYAFRTLTEHIIPEFDEDLKEVQLFKTTGSPAYFGTKYRGLKLPNFVGVIWTHIRLSFKTDSFSIMACFGAESLDITESFEAPCVGNSETLTSQERIAKWLGIIGSAAGGIFQISAGGAGVVTGALSLAGTAVNAVTPQANGTYIGGGTAFDTWADIISGSAQKQSVIGVRTYIDIEATDVSNPAINYIQDHGGECNYEVYNNIDFIAYVELAKNYTFIANAGSKSEVFVAMETAVQGVPLNAAEAIKTLLLNGVHLEAYEVTQSG